MENIDNIGCMCPSCGENILDDKCQYCEFSFSQFFKCPQLTENNICNKTKRTCNISGLDFEICDTFRNSQS